MTYNGGCLLTMLDTITIPELQLCCLLDAYLRVNFAPQFVVCASMHGLPCNPAECDAATGLQTAVDLDIHSTYTRAVSRNNVARLMQLSDGS